MDRGTYDPEGLIAGAGQEKSGNGRSAPTGIRRFGEVAFFSRIARVAYDPRSWLPELDRGKAEAPV